MWRLRLNKINRRKSYHASKIQTTLSSSILLPLIEEIFDKIGETEVLLKLDYQTVVSGSLTQDAKERSAFITPFGKFAFTRMPFEMRNARTTFQRLMDTVWLGSKQY